MSIFIALYTQYITQQVFKDPLSPILIRRSIKTFLTVLNYILIFLTFILAAVCIPSVMISRNIAGAHYFTDVAGGFLITMLFYSVAMWLEPDS